LVPLGCGFAILGAGARTTRRTGGFGAGAGAKDPTAACGG
jgi:hypothetical protein